MGAGWFAATALGVALAALCSHLLLLRPPFAGLDGQAAAGEAVADPARLASGR